MKKKSISQRYLKVQYPDSCCPIITVKKCSRRITVLSSGALVINTKCLSPCMMGSIVDGMITYPNGDKEKIRGYVIFIKGKSIVLKLFDSISFQRINDQIQWLRRNYPRFDPRMKT